MYEKNDMEKFILDLKSCPLAKLDIVLNITENEKNDNNKEFLKKNEEIIIRT